MIALILILLLWASPAMAWLSPPCDTFSSSATEADPQTLNYTVGTTSTSNRAVIVETSWRHEGGTVSGVTFNGVAMDQIGTSSINTTPTPDVGVAQWIATNVSSGTYTVSVNWSGVLTQSTVVAYTCYGVDQATPVRESSPNKSTATTNTVVSVNVASAVGDLVIDSVVVSAVDAGEPTIGAGQTAIGSCVPNGTTNLDSCTSYQVGAATVAMSWSAATLEHWALTAFSLQPATVAGSVGFGVLRRR